MKVLWLSITPGLKQSAGGVGSWIEALQRVVANIPDLEVAIAYITNQQDKKEVLDDFIYYPISVKRNSLQRRFIDTYTVKYEDECILSECVNIIGDYQPDVIHCFGSEWCWGNLYGRVNVPIVIHIQGFWPSYYYYATETRFYQSYLFRLRVKPTSFWYPFLARHKSKERADREEKIIHKNKYFMGRTHWDRAIVDVLNEQAKYFFCSEALRTEFINSPKHWEYKNKSTLRLITTGGAGDIKGMDLLLKTARLLKIWSNVNFEWRIIGATEEHLRYQKFLTDIDATSVNVVPLNRINANRIIEELLDSDIYVHTSYIDNSPNAICEAQYLGVPIITTRTGGVRSLFTNNYPEENFVPSGEPYALASQIIKIYKDKKQLEEMSCQNSNLSRKRHNDKSIALDLLHCYESVISDYHK